MFSYIYWPCSFTLCLFFHTFVYRLLEVHILPSMLGEFAENSALTDTNYDFHRLPNYVFKLSFHILYLNKLKFLLFHKNFLES